MPIAILLQSTEKHNTVHKHYITLSPNTTDLPNTIEIAPTPAINKLPNLCTVTSGIPLTNVIVDRLGAFFYWTRFGWRQCTVRQYHSDLSHQTALENMVRIRL